MSYKELVNFKDIINRNDFSYISDLFNIDAVTEIMKNITLPSLSVSTSKNTLQIYLNNLTLFYNSFGGNNIPDLKEGFQIAAKQIESMLNILDSSDRFSIGSGMKNKFVKTFLYGLNKILGGLRLAFDPNYIGKTKLVTGQIAKYVLDKKEGLGKVYAFNSFGKHSPAEKLFTFTKDQLSFTIKLLTRRLPIRKYGGWTDLGAGRDPIRILLQKKNFSRDKVYFLYNMAEHIPRGGPYHRTLTNSSPDKERFVEAA